MSKSEARDAVEEIVRDGLQTESTESFKVFVETVYFPYYKRKWKASTAEENVNRISNHLVRVLGARKLAELKRDELQDILDAKALKHSFSIVSHLRWDLKQILDMAVAEGKIILNPALLLFTPNSAKRPIRKVMNKEEVQRCFASLGQRDGLIVKLAVIGGMRPGEIFALTWGQMKETHAEIRQRVYRNRIDTPKTENSYRKAALSSGLLKEIDEWRKVAATTDENAWVFPSEKMTPLAKENVWRRSIGPALEKAGLGWVNFQVMRRTSATLLNAVGGNGKLVADQLGHSLDTSQNVYVQSPIDVRIPILNELERFIQAN
jgi:integrase